MNMKALEILPFQKFFNQATHRMLKDYNLIPFHKQSVAKPCLSSS